MTEPLQRLQELAKKISGSKTITTTLSPCLADEKARVYEARRADWQTLIFGRAVILLAAQFVQQNPDCWTALNLESINAEADMALQQWEKKIANQDQEIDLSNGNELIASTQQMLEDCPVIWQRIKDKENHLKDSVNRVLEEYVGENVNTGGDSEWTVVCGLMQEQRDLLKADIDKHNDKIKSYEAQVARPALDKLHRCMGELRELRNQLASQKSNLDRLEGVMAEAHGILLPDDGIEDGATDFDSFLIDEEEAMSEYYTAKTRRHVRIFQSRIASIKEISDGEKQVVIELVANPSWIKLYTESIVGRPLLKAVIITWSSLSPSPIDIIVKVDFTNVAGDKFEEVKSQLVPAVNSWKNDGLKNGGLLDLHRLILLFLD